MDWITDQISIGNVFDAQSLPREIETVLCLLAGCCTDRTDVDALCVPLQDGPGNRPGDLEDALRFLDDAVRAGERVLVHCHAGRSRSVVVVARYLMQSRGLTTQAALDLIASRREIYLSPGIDESAHPPLTGTPPCLGPHSAPAPDSRLASTCLRNKGSASDDRSVCPETPSPRPASRFSSAVFTATPRRMTAIIERCRTRTSRVDCSAWLRVRRLRKAIAHGL